MIDKSLRQHYQDGENVGPFEKGKNIIMSAIPSQQITPASIARNVVTRGIGKKLAGTGILSSLGPIGALLAMFLARKGMDFASKKWGEGGVQQALTSGFAGLGVGSPEEQRELRVLEKRRADMLQRKEEGRNYSERNLDIVTRAIAEAKGLDINNPNEMKNIDKPITQIQTERSITEPQIIPETPEIISPHLEGDRTIPTPTTLKGDPFYVDGEFQTFQQPTFFDPKDYPYQGVTQTGYKTLGYTESGDPIQDFRGNVQSDTGIALGYKTPRTIHDQVYEAQQKEKAKAAATQAAAIKAENDRQQREADAAAAAAARAAVARAYTPPVRHHTGGGGNGGGGGMGRGRDPGGGAAGSPFFRGGRVDKALGGRSRDI